MLDPRWQKVLRDASTQLPRMTLVAFAIAVALGGAGTVLVSWALVRRATIEGFQGSHPASATLRTDAIDDSLLAAVRALPGVADAQARRTIALPLQVNGTWRSGLLFAVDDPADVRIGTLTSAGGVWPPPDGSIAVERSSQDFSGAVVGDSLLVRASDSTTRAVSIAGIVRDVGLAPGWMEHVVYGWTSTRTLATLGLPSTRNELQLLVADPRASRAEVRLVAESVRRLLDSRGHPVTDVDVPEPGEHIHAAQMDSMLMTQGAFGLLALVVGVFLVVNLLAAMLTGQIREIGVMKTLGASDEQLQAMYLTFAAGTGIIATALALPASVIFGRRYAAMRGDMLNFDVAAFAIPWWSVAAVALAGVVMPVVAAWFPVRRGARITVAAALRDLGLADGDDTPGPSAPAPGSTTWLSRSLMRRGGWSRILTLSLRNAFRRRQRMWLTTLTLASGGAVFVAAGNLRRAVIGSLDVIYGSQRYAFSVRLAEAQDPGLVTSLVRGVAGVEDAEAWAGARAVVVTNGLSGATFPLTAAPDDSRLLAIDIIDGTGLDGTEGRSLVLSRSFRRVAPDLVPGAHVVLEVGGRREEWTVVGLFEGGPNPVAYTTTAALNAARGATTRGSVMVATPMEGLASKVDLVQRVRAALATAGIPVSSTAMLEESRRVTEDHLLMVVQFLSLMGWVMILVGGMGLASTMGLAVLERTREIAVMRAIGAPHATLFGLIQAEGLVIALLGWLVAIPLSLPFSLVLGEAFGRIMFRVPVRWAPDGTSVFLWLGMVVAVSLVACAVPALRATRQTVARALTYG